ncbi:hypothetical protein NIES4101_46080 [Calothrix sp. NIES-4101]|nr:hypothetical protein NIES4101_46080 [Calothrix sp. NIES-4101]
MLAENKQPQITVEVPTPSAQPYYQPQKRDKIAEVRYKLLEAFLPAKDWEDNALTIVSYIAAPMFAVSILQSIVIPLPLTILIFAVYGAIFLSVVWVWRYIPEISIWVTIRLVLTALGLLLGIGL